MQLISVLRAMTVDMVMLVVRMMEKKEQDSEHGKKVQLTYMAVPSHLQLSACQNGEVARVQYFHLTTTFCSPIDFMHLHTILQ
jgi:hypothetical protein